MKLPQEFLEKQKVLLVAEQLRLESEIKNLKKFPDYGTLSDEQAEELTDFETNASIGEQLEILLKKVKAALDAIDDGTYGTCKKCGGIIERGRLEAMPYASVCATCRSKK